MVKKGGKSLLRKSPWVCPNIDQIRNPMWENNLQILRIFIAIFQRTPLGLHSWGIGKTFLNLKTVFLDEVSGYTQQIQKIILINDVLILWVGETHLRYCNQLTQTPQKCTQFRFRQLNQNGWLKNGPNDPQPQSWSPHIRLPSGQSGDVRAIFSGHGVTRRVHFGVRLGCRAFPTELRHPGGGVGGGDRRLHCVR